MVSTSDHRPANATARAAWIRLRAPRSPRKASNVSKTVPARIWTQMATYAISCVILSAPSIVRSTRGQWDLPDQYQLWRRHRRILQLQERQRPPGRLYPRTVLALHLSAGVGCFVRKSRASPVGRCSAPFHHARWLMISRSPGAFRKKREHS
jgi:hypothetical protein